MKLNFSTSSAWALPLLPFVFSLAQSVSGAPEPLSKKSCQHPIVRKEWRELSKKDQLSYIDAVKCLQVTKPPLTPISEVPGIGTRFDDFAVPHIRQMLAVHFVGHFLPWHRFLVAAYEKALREECGLKIAQPYWDWTLDVTPASSFPRSPIFDPVYGFGGNGPFVPMPPGTPPETIVPGRSGGGCVQDGPFKNMTVRLGPKDDLSGNPRCLRRDLSPEYASTFLNKDFTYATLTASDYGHFARAVDGDELLKDSGVHSGAHFSIGGNMGENADLYNSPSDPLFYLLHANLDRVWWSWEAKDLSVRVEDISGPIFHMDYDNVLGGNVTLGFPLSIQYNAKNVTVGDVMNIQGGTLCYTYGRLY